MSRTYMIPATEAGWLLEWLTQRYPRRPPIEFKGEAIKLTLERWHPRHTSEQMAKYRAILHEFGETLGYTAREADEVIHEHLLCEVFGVADEVVFAGETRRYPIKRSSQLTIEDFSKLIEALRRMAADYGVILS